MCIVQFCKMLDSRPSTNQAPAQHGRGNGGQTTILPGTAFGFGNRMTLRSLALSWSRARSYRNHVQAISAPR